MSVPATSCSITVVIPFVAGASRLDACLRSIAAQDPGGVCRVIVVVNGAAEPVPEIEGLGHRLSILRLDQNLGFGAAINAASVNVATDLMFVLNDDTRVGTDCLRAIVAAAERHRDADCFATQVRSADESELQSAGLMFSPTGFGNRSNRQLLAHVTEDTEVFGACGAAAVYRTEAFVRLGGFNDRFFFMYEDLELALRAVLAGHKCVYIPSAKVFHAKGATIGTNWSLKVQEGFRNCLYTAITCVPTPFLTKYFREIARFYVWFVLTLIRDGFAMEVLSGLFRLVSEGRELYRRRRLLMPSATAHWERLDRLLYRGVIEIQGPSGSRLYHPLRDAKGGNV